MVVFREAAEKKIEDPVGGNKKNDRKSNMEMLKVTEGS